VQRRLKPLGVEGVRRDRSADALLPGVIAAVMVRGMPAAVLERVTAALPMGRMGEPGEVAHLVAFLASEQAGYVTGQTIEISGGGDLNLLSLGSARQE